MTQYETMRTNPSVAIRAFCLHKTPDLKPSYTLEEVEAFEKQLGEPLGLLGIYLTEVSRETVFGYYRHLIMLEVPTRERILGTATKQRGNLMNSEQLPSTLLRITTDGCAFSKALVIKGHFLGTVWALSDDEPELIAADFESWLCMGMKQVMISMLPAANVKEAGGIKEYNEQQRKKYDEQKKIRQAEIRKKRAMAEKEWIAKMQAMLKEAKDLTAKMKAISAERDQKAKEKESGNEDKSSEDN